MSPKRRRFSPLPLVGLSALLALLPSTTSQRARLTTLSAFSPFQVLGRAACRLLPSARAGADEAQLRKENEFLRDQVVKLENDRTKLKQKLDQVSQFRQQVKDPQFRTLHADVSVSADGSPWRKSLTIALGSRGGVQKGMLVAYNNQLVGRVLEVGPWSSRVQVVTDPGFRAGAVATPKTHPSGVSFEKRHVGVYEGTSGERGHLKWLTGDTPVETGATVLTTEDPANGVPAGLVLGRIAALSTGRGLYAKVEVEPLVHFRGLEQVMLLARGEDR